MRILGLFIVLGIFAWEMYSPTPDTDRLQFEQYKDKTVSLSATGIPQAVLIYYKIETVYGFRNMKKPPNPTELKSWVNFVENRKKLIKFDLWLKTKNE